MSLAMRVSLSQIPFTEAEMKAYYSCIIGCEITDTKCINACAMKTFNTTIAEFKMNGYELNEAQYLCDYNDLSCIFSESYN
eukprot:CAMPEP_0170547330 /NCGR_PEP_ID=MMETSP0211-20121228/5712_1 /TAXON_ID=311385 /ORGANISM="Pseudokeronopsis sp., Strain OXSARD2" /LENGTH=80 /DNA_ID=CAMNT_0010852305 /DNA_START=667 /DNA_END=909 /DNA_ORIENTATION=+